MAMTRCDKCDSACQLPNVRTDPPYQGVPVAQVVAIKRADEDMLDPVCMDLQTSVTAPHVKNRMDFSYLYLMGTVFQKPFNGCITDHVMPVVNVSTGCQTPAPAEIN